MANRKKTTVYLDEGLLRRAKIVASRADQAVDEVLEAALRRYLGVDACERVWSSSELSEAEALTIAYDELDAARSRR